MANHLTFDALTRVLERRASVIEESRARRHLAGCARCRSELEWLERIRTLPDHRHSFLNVKDADRVGSASDEPTAGDALGDSRGGARGRVAPHWLGPQVLIR